MSSNVILHPQGCSFSGVVDSAAHLDPQNLYFGGVNGRFQAKRVEY